MILCMMTFPAPATQSPGDLRGLVPRRPRARDRQRRQEGRPLERGAWHPGELADDRRPCCSSADELSATLHRRSARSDNLPCLFMPPRWSGIERMALRGSPIRLGSGQGARSSAKAPAQGHTLGASQGMAALLYTDGF